MTFSNTVSGITPGDTTRNATKIPQWAGYVYKSTTGLSDADVAANKHRLVFVKTNGDQYVYKWDGTANYAYEGLLSHTGTSTLAALTGTPVAGTTLVLDADLLEAMTYDTWEIGSQALYDVRRTGPGEWM